MTKDEALAIGLELQENDPLENYLMPDEADVFFTLTPEQQNRYLEACSSPEAVEAYLQNPDEPQAAKDLLSGGR